MKKILGFSLIELMVTLIIISVIVGAMTPIITKKLKSQSITVGSGASEQIDTEFEQDCLAFGEDCVLCTQNKCSLCAKECLTGEYIKTSSCECKSCNIYENCKECNSRQCKKCNSGYYLNGSTCEICPAGHKCDGINKNTCSEKTYSLAGSEECTDCTQNCKECNSTTGACQTCDEGYLISKEKCVKDCGSLAFLVSTDEKRFCITKYNIGDGGLDYFASSVSKVSAGSTCDSNSLACCWVGTTSNSSSCNANDSKYSGCKRTVCNWWAARASCNNMTYNGRTWQLPSKEDLAALTSSKELYLSTNEDSLHICPTTDNGITSTCPIGHGKCPGGLSDACIVHLFWAAETHSDRTLYAFNFIGSSIGLDKYYVTGGLSTRCVSYID